MGCKNKDSNTVSNSLLPKELLRYSAKCYQQAMKNGRNGNVELNKCPYFTATKLNKLFEKFF